MAISSIIFFTLGRPTGPPPLSSQPFTRPFPQHSPGPSPALISPFVLTLLALLPPLPILTLLTLCTTISAPRSQPALVCGIMLPARKAAGRMFYTQVDEQIIGMEFLERLAADAT